MEYVHVVLSQDLDLPSDVQLGVQVIGARDQPCCQLGILHDAMDTFS